MTLDAAPPGLRMGNTVERTSTVIAEAFADKRIPELADKCEGLQGLTRVGFFSASLIARQCPAPQVP